MNIQPFLDNYENKNFFKPNPQTWDTQNQKTEYLFLNFGGLSIDLGSFRIHTYESAQKWADIIMESFPQYKNEIIPFGFDWLGRQYAINRNQDNLIIMFDGATGEDFELEQSLEDFFNEEL